MPEYAIDHCPDVELTKMPNDDVHTYDGHVLRLGSIVYFRFTPVPTATEYVVVSDRAIRHNDGHEVIVVCDRGFPVAMNPYDLVQDIEVWWQFWQKRYGPASSRSYKSYGQRANKS